MLIFWIANIIKKSLIYLEGLILKNKFSEVKVLKNIIKNINNMLNLYFYHAKYYDGVHFKF